MPGVNPVDEAPASNETARTEEGTRMYRHIAMGLALIVSVAASPTLHADEAAEETRIEEARRELDRLTRLTRELEAMLRRLETANAAARSTPDKSPAAPRQRFVLGKQGWVLDTKKAQGKPAVVIRKADPVVVQKRRIVIRTEKDGKVEERIYDVDDGDLPADLPKRIKRQLEPRAPRPGQLQPPRTHQQGRSRVKPSALTPKNAASLLDRILKRLDRIDQRLTRIEHHLDRPGPARDGRPPIARRRGRVRFLDRSARSGAPRGPDISDETVERLLQHPDLERLKKEAFEKAWRELRQKEVEEERRRIVLPGKQLERRVIRLAPAEGEKDVEIEIR